MKITCIAATDLTRDRRALAHVRVLAAAGHEVTLHGVLAPGTEPEEDLGPAVIVRSTVPAWVLADAPPSRGSHVVRWMRRYEKLAAAALARGRPDALHVFGLDVAEPVLAAARRLGVPCVVDDPGVCAAERHARVVAARAPGPRRSAALGVLHALTRRADALRRRLVAAGAAAVVTSSPELAADLIARCRVEDPVVVRDAFLRPGNGAPGRLHVRVGALPQELLVAYRGPGGPGSGVDAAVRALATLRGNVGLVLLGWSRVREEIERVAVAAGVEARVRFVPPVPEDELIDLLGAADAAVLPAEPVDRVARLGLPIEVLECFAAGVPIAASDLAATASLVRGTGAGVLWAARDPSDPRAVAEALDTLLRDTSLAALCRERARDAARGELDWRRESRGLVRIYERLADRF